MGVPEGVEGVWAAPRREGGERERKRERARERQEREARERQQVKRPSTT